jgi:DNA-binding CsgD family transcriptional regulator
LPVSIVSSFASGGAAGTRFDVHKTRRSAIVFLLRLAGLFFLRHDRARTLTPEIVAREQELASIRAFIEEAGRGTSMLVLEGEPGIGKSTLWLAGVAHAKANGLRVLSSRPAEAERGLAHAGLGDLFEGVLDDVLPELTAPRRRALEVALLVEEASGDPVDPRALAVAVRGALLRLSDSEPLVIAVDDVQWLDPSSARALAFAARRLEDASIRLLLARRIADGVEASELEEALSHEHVRRIEVGPLSVGAVHRLLSERLGRTFPRQTLVRIHERSGGNPFFALETARALEGDVDPLEPLPVPQTLEGLVRVRLTGLPPATREALGLAAALGTPSEDLLARAGVAAGALDPALAEHVVEREEGTIRFTHPLLSSALYKDLGDRRQSVHARIAEVVDDPVGRGRHLALSRDEPDAEIAATLDEAAILAAERGAWAVSAELSEHAMRLTPESETAEGGRRALAAARAHQAAGEWTRARTITTSLAEAERGQLRAESLVLLAEFEPIDGSIALLEEAFREAESSPVLRTDIEIRLASAIRFREGFAEAHRRAAAALELAEQLDDNLLRVRALTVLADLGSAIGDEEAPAHAARALELSGESGQPRLEHLVAYAAAIALGDDDRAVREFLEEEYERWRERDEPRSADVLWALSMVELDAGSWELAAEHAARARDIAFQYGIEIPQHHLPIAWIAVHRGQLDLARETSMWALELAEEHFGFHPPYHLAVIGLVAFWRGDASTGAEWLGRAHSRALQLGWFDPSNRPWTDDYVEALLELGRIDEAVEIVDRWEADARRLGRQRVLAYVMRCRGQVAAARGDIDEAIALLEDAIARHAELGDPYGHGRALLALGIARRRARQKRPAREAIVQALEAFEELGAATWVERAKAELGSIGGRTREEGLTPAEQRVAALVAEGRTNREVAAALFLGERTVASHLTHIYAKLGIRSRTELARVLPDVAPDKVQTF